MRVGVAVLLLVAVVHGIPFHHLAQVSGVSGVPAPPPPTDEEMREWIRSHVGDPGGAMPEMGPNAEAVPTNHIPTAAQPTTAQPKPKTVVVAEKANAARSTAPLSSPDMERGVRSETDSEPVPLDAPLDAPQDAPQTPPVVLADSRRGKCSTQDRKGRMMFAVVSAPTHFGARDAIRASWAADAAARGIDVKFFVGELAADLPNRNQVEQQLGKESDMVRLSGFTENYHNLTAKALAVFDYAYDSCNEAVMKVDDDTYVRVDSLMSFLSGKDWSNLYAGDMIRNSPVVKDPNGRWYAYDQYPNDKWPTYANGPGVFLGLRGLAHLHENKESLNKIRIDDAAVGVWTQELNLNVADMPIACFSYNPNPNAIWVNPVNLDEMARLHAGSTFVLKACEPPQTTACLCWGSPHFSAADNGQCWKRAGEEQYQDLVPRHAVH